MEDNYEYTGSVTIDPEYLKPSITFSVANSSEPIIVIKEGKFKWKGEEVEDVHEVYRRFNEWLTAVHWSERRVSPQDPAIDDMLEIEETDEEAAYRKGYMDGYDEGLYDGQYK